ncbi:hypothetical protein [Treponema sp. R80B11-R83G3]
MASSLKRKKLFLVLAVCIAFSVVFTINQTAAILDHNHTEHDCPHCRQIEAAKYFIKIIKLALVGLFFTIFLFFPSQIHKKDAESVAYTLSPVTLKVRFNT